MRISEFLSLRKYNGKIHPYRLAPYALDRVTYRHIPNIVQGTGTIVVVTNDEREKDVVLQDERLWLVGVPLGPWDPEAFFSVRI
jgi:hypothetical protein